MSLRKQYIFQVLILIWTFEVLSQDYDTGLRDRSAAITVQTADSYQPPPLTVEDPEKYYWPKVIARFEHYGCYDSTANRWIEMLKDRSPFHFTLVGMARIMSLYPDAPAIRNNKILLLKKVFERYDSYNAFTGEGTENHINMSRTSGYIFAQHALDYPDEFPDAMNKLQMMKNWLMEWSGKIYQYGTGEWNSSIYETYNVIGWLNIYDFARDVELKNAARAVLDYYASEMALHYSWGTTGGAEMRGTGAENLNTNATRYLCWLWFGSDTIPGSSEFTGSQYIQCMHAVTSSYRPPDLLIKLANKECAAPAWYINSKPSYLFEEPSFVRQFFYISENYTLGSCISPYGGWTGSTYQMVNWRLIIRSTDGNVPFEIGGNGHFYNNLSGKTTNPFTQVVQHRNILIQMTRTPENVNEIIEQIRLIVDNWAEKWQEDFLIRFPGDEKSRVVKMNSGITGLNESYITLPENSVSKTGNNCCVITVGDVYLGITLISGVKCPSLSRMTGIKDRWFIMDRANPGSLCGFIIEIAEKSEYGSPDRFLDSLTSINRLDKSLITKGIIHYRTTDGTLISARYGPDGIFSEAISDWGYGSHSQQVMISSPPFLQPVWPEITGTGRIPGLWINGTEISFHGTWPVFDGPLLKLDKGIMEIMDDQKVYQVDYSGDRPVFRTYGKR
jgi:hypothetical protein